MTFRRLATLTASLAAIGWLATAPVVHTPPAHAMTDAQKSKMSAMNTLTGRSFDYEVAGYKIRVEFLAEDKLRWTYIEAPDGQAGKTADESVDRRDIHYGIVLLAWTEKDGTNVVDILDLQTMSMHANAVLPNGKRFFTKTAVTEVK